MKSFLGSTAVLAVLSVVSAVDITLDIVNTNLAPDGFNRSVIVANGTYPGPPILLTKGDTLNVFVNNSLVDGSMRRSIAMDFDGIFVNTSNWWNEGSDFVASCPVGPNMTFTYNLPTGNQTGTFWYHSQLSAQYVDGLRGPLIIYDPEDPHLDLYDVDDVTTIIELGDWWQIVTPVLLASYESTGIVPVSDSGTINGVGRFQGGPEVPFPVFTVQQGKRYRFRLINESARNVFTVSFDDHNMTIIETDGVPNVPLVTDELMMLAGQRHSVVLVANQTVGNYWFNAPFVGGSPANNKAGHQNASLTRAILRYEGAPDEEPAGPFTLGPQNGTGGIVEPLLQPLVPVSPPDPDVTLNFTLSVVTGRAIWQINGVSYLPPLTPTLVKVLAGADTEASFNETENTFILPANATIEVNFPPSDDDEEHPFHLHGNNFWVIKGNFSDTPNTVNPLVRDTVGVGSTGTTVRFRTDQPGPMFFHCHIFWHKQAGLASVLLSGPDETREAERPSNEWLNLCQAYRDLPEDAQ